MSNVMDKLRLKPDFAIYGIITEESKKAIKEIENNDDRGMIEVSDPEEKNIGN